MTHTPGPWKLIWWGDEKYPYPLSIHTEDDTRWICRDGLVARPEDAHLLAAAPEMLEALKQGGGTLGAILAEMEEGGPEVSADTIGHAYHAIRAAIAKAKGVAE